jgi:hypothetical protein
MLSAEEPGIQRPGARADHRQGCAEDRGWPEKECCSGSKTQSTPLLSLPELRRPGSTILPPVKLRQALLYFGAPEFRKPALHSGSRRRNKAAHLL